VAKKRVNKGSSLDPILEKMRVVLFKLKMLKSSRIQPAFHASQFKREIGNYSTMLLYWMAWK